MSELASEKLEALKKDRDLDGGREHRSKDTQRVYDNIRFQKKFQDNPVETKNYNKKINCKYKSILGTEDMARKYLQDRQAVKVGGIGKIGVLKEIPEEKERCFSKHIIPDNNHIWYCGCDNSNFVFVTCIWSRII